MSTAVFFNTYKLKDGVSVPDFLASAEKLHHEYISKQQGYISFQLLADGEAWADSTVFESMNDARKFAEACEPNEFADKFYSFLDFDSCTSKFYTVEKDLR